MNIFIVPLIFFLNAHAGTCVESVFSKYDLDKKNVIYVGDEISDIKASKKFGIKIPR